MKYLTPKELAERWQISAFTLRNWRHLKQGPKFIKLGTGTKSSVRYELKEVIRYENKMTAKAK